MRAIRMTAPRRIELVEAPMPVPNDGQVLVRVERLSICGSDMRPLRRVAPEEAYPMPVGFPCHECLGVVEASRSAGVPEGQRVIALPTGLQGGGEYLLADAARVVPVPDGGDPAGLLMCQPLGTVLYACKQMGSLLGRRVAVVGQGAIGLLFTTALSSLGAALVIGVDPLDYRLEYAVRHGATHVVNPARENAVAVVERLTNGAGADVVVEASGSEEGINRVYDLVRRQGTVVLFGMPEEDTVRLNYMKVMRRQPLVVPTVSGSSPDPTGSIAEAMALVTQGKLDVSWLVTHRWPFARAEAAYQMYEARTNGVLKVVMEI